MNYASPQATHICNCRDNGMAPMFCPTGHLTECHHPLDCQEAACSHLPRYDEEMDQSEMDQSEMDQSEMDQSEMELLEKLAINHLQQLADPSCTRCSGEGRTEIQSTTPGPDLLQPEAVEEFTFTSTAVCPCVSNPTARQAQEDAGKT